jgi:hypothetical protein
VVAAWLLAPTLSRLIDGIAAVVHFPSGSSRSHIERGRSRLARVHDDARIDPGSGDKEVCAG